MTLAWQSPPKTKFLYLCLIFKADIAIEAEVNGMVEEIARKWGHIDALVNNAGPSSFWLRTSRAYHGRDYQR
jgi:NAD(P)-dependent dehydrogenase (short-subunit alcohol dehydrogenase family)